MSLSDNSICPLCDKQHTTKQYLSETHTRPDPLPVPICSGRRRLLQAGAYVVRKMTPSKHRYPGGSYNVALPPFFFLSFLCTSWFGTCVGCFTRCQVAEEAGGNTSVNPALGLWVSTEAVPPKPSSGLTRSPHWPLSCPFCAKVKAKEVLCQTSSPCSSLDGASTQPREIPSHLGVVPGVASTFANQASSFSDPAPALAVGRVYGDQRDTPNSTAFSGLGMVKPFLKVAPPPVGTTSRLQPFTRLPRELLLSRYWALLLEMVQDTRQFSISRAHEEQWCR